MVAPEPSPHPPRYGGALHLESGQFFGNTRLSCRAPGIRVTHSLAAGPPDSVVTHTHADLHFILVSGGEYVSAAGPSPGEGPALIYNPPGTTHRDHFERGRGSFFSISVAPEYLQNTIAERVPEAAPAHLTQRLQHTLATSVAACCARRVDPLTLDALCLELLATVLPGFERAPAAAPPWLSRALELLHDRYEAALSMADIARAVGVHPIHLARTFRRHFRCTPAVFAQFRRLEKAARLLGRSAEPLAQIAQDCGFADQSHLTHAFTRGLGVPPGTYRSLAGGVPRLQIDKTSPERWSRVSAAAAQARKRAKGCQ